MLIILSVSHLNGEHNDRHVIHLFYLPIFESLNYLIKQLLFSTIQLRCTQKCLVDNISSDHFYTLNPKNFIVLRLAFSSIIFFFIFLLLDLHRRFDHIVAWGHPELPFKQMSLEQDIKYRAPMMNSFINSLEGFNILSEIVLQNQANQREKEERPWVVIHTPLLKFTIT